MYKNLNKIKIEITTISILKLALAVFLVWLVYMLREIVIILFFVFVIVAALGPLVDRMSKYMPRILATLILSAAFLGVLTGIGFLIIPPIIQQIGQLAVNIPVYIDRLGPFYQSLKSLMPNYQEHLVNLSSQVGNLSSGIYTTTINFASGLVATGTILILAFYMLLEQNALKNFLYNIVPEEHKLKIFEILQKITFKMGSWLRGTIILMFIIGILDGIILTILNIPYALTLAVWAGLTEVIPYIGPWLGLIPAAIIAFTVSPWLALFVVIAYILVQQLESAVLAPKIMSRAVGLSPVIIIIALLAGAKLMGVLGMLVAVPVAGALSVVVQEWPEIKKIKDKI